MTHKTKGIVLRTVKYGETSVIVSAYTELFGLQSYLVKGVRQQARKSSGKAIYFQPGAILDMVVYHNEQKNLNFIKEYQWAYLYNEILFDVVKNTVAMYMIEMLQRCLKQPEANAELYYLAEDSLKQLDKATPLLIANLPLYFALHLGGELGFRIQGAYTKETAYCDLVEGMFVEEKPNNNYYLEGQEAQITSGLLGVQFYNDLETLVIAREVRQHLIAAYQQYIALHVSDFGEMRSLAILQEILR